MTSISLPATLLSQFDSTPNTPPRSPHAHRQRPSRNSNPVPPPIFSFNPGSDENAFGTGGSESTSQPCHTVAAEPPRRSTRPLPLPDFKFNPGADLPPESSPSPTHPVLQEMALNQQRAIRSARPAPLPAFAFTPNPSSTQASPSPTKSSFAGDAQHSARTGHRRHGSEFVGGGNDGPQMVSTSPEKPEYRPHPPITGASRGHAHRRSQAVSISDIDTSELIKANALARARAGSTPTTPSDGAQAISFPRASPRMQQSMSNIVRTPPSSPRRRGSVPGIRPRVGFSDQVDVIPRPLSLISSETEGSNSTIRGGHSLNGSINSTASPTPRPSLAVSYSSDASTSPERPQTAGSLSTLPSNMVSKDGSVSMISLPKRPLSASGTPGSLSSGSPPNKKKYFWFNHSNSGSPSVAPRSEQADPADVFASTSSQDRSLKVFGEQSRPKTSAGESSSTSKKRKYHTWTSGIFSRKSEKRLGKTKQEEIPALPPLTRLPSDKLNEIFDADDTIVIRNPSPVSTRVRAPVQNVAPAPTWTTGHLEEQITSPVLDLDAALGPFGSEEKLGHDGTVGTGPSSRLAKLHSSERRGNVDAFGTVHRRTESAPIMPAVNRSAFSVHRIGSNASLAEDVFDEEEEDNFLAEENANTAGQGASMDDHSNLSSKNSGDATNSATQVGLSTPDSKTAEGLGLPIGNESGDGVIIVDAEEDITRVDARSSNSTIEAPVFPDLEGEKRPMSSPMAFAYPTPQSHYASSTEGRTTSASMMSSPDADHVSFDTLSRPNRFLGEPSPEFVLRASNDDLPSLSDSISSGALPRFSSSAGTRSSVEQRSASMIVPSTSRSNNQQAWKRASLASLNRLIPGSSNGSKLKFETVPDTAVIDEKSRRKTNRISKLVHFWRSKEKAENTCN
ncbi:uncharacterized protein Z518_06315 [Rhinocladiella mackenziei CBS 650.93]|uniref:Cell wall proline rich protein n=1 Tax=Rhinocladiella mackenziei CBS 650.93 TaxID=1442369 RepID=A0A0D2H4W6_9EURO|nr:uncharacterized protein Z518_06315 [Rhinocladiella mackenziei CBS 650.93]KIX05443.1 hypothetical protein Z518_06315 [Rhinocladiella mackenziei CBS 650.93]